MLSRALDFRRLLMKNVLLIGFICIYFMLCAKTNAATLNKTASGDGSSNTVTIQNAQAVQNVSNPVGFVDYVNNPILTGADHGTPHAYQNIYSPATLWNPNLNLYEMYYGGWDYTYVTSPVDNIYVARSPDKLNWTKNKVVMSSSPGRSFQDADDNQYYNTDYGHVNDPDIIDVPAWNMRVMLYTCVGGLNGANHICIATAPLYGDTFTRANPLVDTGTTDIYSGDEIKYSVGLTDFWTYGTSGDVGNPSGYFDGTSIQFWFMSYIEPYNYGQGSISYSGGALVPTPTQDPNIVPMGQFVATPAAISPIPIFQGYYDACFRKVGNQCMTVGRANVLDDPQFISSDCVNWTAVTGYSELFGEGSAYTPIVKLTSQYFIDYDGIIHGIYNGVSTTNSDENIQIHVRPLLRGAKLYTSGGTVITANYKALDFNTFQIQLPGGTTYPITGTLKGFDEAGNIISTVAGIFYGGDAYSWDVSLPAPVFKRTVNIKMK